MSGNLRSEGLNSPFGGGSMNGEVRKIQTPLAFKGK
jgi:hypothetical protein